MWLLRDTAFSNYGPYVALPAFVLSSAFRDFTLNYRFRVTREYVLKGCSSALEARPPPSPFDPRNWLVRICRAPLTFTNWLQLAAEVDKK